MSEQEEIKKKRKKKLQGFGESNPIYYTKEFLEKLEDLYNIYQSYSVVARNLNGIFGTDISGPSVQNIYIKKIASTISQSKEAGEYFENSFKKMKSRWESAWEMVGDLIYHYQKLKEMSKDKNDSEKALFFMKMTPTIIQITTEIRKQLEHISGQQEQIKIQQINNIYSPIQINQHIYKVLNNWATKGYITIHKNIPEMDVDNGSNKLNEEKEDGKKDKSDGTG